MSEVADMLIRRLGLLPHPEGGHYRETFRDKTDGTGRSHSTAIYFLLKAGERSAWHRIDAVEIWHWYAGAPLSLAMRDENGEYAHMLGNDIASGQAPQIVVAAKAWQSAHTLGDYTLAGCTVAPGFLFETFELAPGETAPTRTNE